MEGPNIASGKTVSSTRAVHIQNGGGSGTLSTQYGIVVDSLTKGATNYAIYTGTGIVRFGGDLAHAGSAVGFYGATPVSRPSLAAATGTTTRTAFATGSVSTAALAERVKAIIDDLRAWGLYS